ncbi:MAG: hypothetical protein WA869_11390, partial [Alloacidobacterium sp.]
MRSHRVWASVVVSEENLKVQISALRKARQAGNAKEWAMEFGIFNLMGSRDSEKPAAEVFAEVTEQTRLA